MFLFGWIKSVFERAPFGVPDRVSFQFRKIYYIFFPQILNPTSWARWSRSASARVNPVSRADRPLLPTTPSTWWARDSLTRLLQIFNSGWKEKSTAPHYPLHLGVSRDSLTRWVQNFYSGWKEKLILSFTIYLVKLRKIKQGTLAFRLQSCLVAAFTYSIGRSDFRPFWLS